MCKLVLMECINIVFVLCIETYDRDFNLTNNLKHMNKNIRRTTHKGSLLYIWYDIDMKFYVSN